MLRLCALGWDVGRGKKCHSFKLFDGFSCHCVHVLCMAAEVNAHKLVHQTMETTLQIIKIYESPSVNRPIPLSR